MQVEATIYFGVWWVLFEYRSFDLFPKRKRDFQGEEVGGLNIFLTLLLFPSMQIPHTE